MTIYSLLWRHFTMMQLILHFSLLKLSTLIPTNPSHTGKPLLDLWQLNGRSLSTLSWNLSTTYHARNMLPSLDTAEADYMALSSAVQQAVWLRRLLEDLGLRLLLRSCTRTTKLPSREHDPAKNRANRHTLSLLLREVKSLWKTAPPT